MDEAELMIEVRQIVEPGGKGDFADGKTCFDQLVPHEMNSHLGQEPGERLSRVLFELPLERCLAHSGCLHDIG